MTRIVRALSLVFLFAIPFGTAKFLFAFPFPFSNVYTGEYTSAFLWGTDVLLVALIAGALALFPRCFRELLTAWWPAPAFLLLALLSLAGAAYGALGVYHWVRLVLAAGAAFALATFLREGVIRFRTVAVVLTASAVSQALLGIFQTATDGDAGLHVLGEAVITPVTKGVGRVVLEGGELLRAMGTLPHANIFAGFLIVGLAAACYLFLTRGEGRFRYGWAATAASIAVLVVGLVVSFSRSGWLVALALVVGMLTVGFLRPEFRRRALELTGLLVLIAGILFAVLSWAIVPRAGFAPGEGSVTHRYLYDVIGVETMVAHPVGVGVGNQLLTGVDEGRYQTKGLTSWWHWQPVHNLYLMVGAETGIAGIVVFLLFLALLFLRARPFFTGTTVEVNGAVLMLLALLAFGLFDHFLWDLQTGRLMLWSVLGILIGVSASPASRA
jgi:hypothetical protein